MEAHIMRKISPYTRAIQRTSQTQKKIRNGEVDIETVRAKKMRAIHTKAPE
jgi:hypothetical protein